MKSYMLFHLLPQMHALKSNIRETQAWDAKVVTSGAEVLKTPSEGAMPSKPWQAGRTEGTGITPSAAECHTRDHPAFTQICKSISLPRGHRRQEARDLTGCKGKSSLTSEVTLQSLLY